MSSSYRRRNEINSQAKKEQSNINISINIKDKNKLISSNNISNIGKKGDKNKLSTDNNKNNINSNKNINKKESLNENKNGNETIILLYPENEPRGTFSCENIKDHIKRDVLFNSFNGKEKISFVNYKAPLLNGFYEAHSIHYPIRLKPDDIWLLIIQAFSNHINVNSEELRKMFVNFDGKKTLKINFYGVLDIKDLTKEKYEEFIKLINNEIENCLGSQLIDILTPNFTTTDKNSSIICKISVMSVFKKYFKYKMGIGPCICGVPYIILEGNASDYKKILEKINFLKKYDFDWYVNRIARHIKKMIEAKEGKIDIQYFKNFIQDAKITEKYSNGCIPPYDKKFDSIKGWFVDFFAYFGGEKSYQRVKDRSIKLEDLNSLASQMLVVPFTIVNSKNNQKDEMKFNVGFFGCGINNKNEVYPVSGWLLSHMTKQDKESIL